ncbi:MAG: hypothetical protein CSA22_06795 [Deltaproteobacteria bacterium]|nr:MAG: hypothetical protein CSA22_06795 [Deltaproteobacteria bacterium]
MNHPKHWNKSSQTAVGFTFLTGQPKMKFLIDCVRIFYKSAINYGVMMVVTAIVLGLGPVVSDAGENADDYLLEPITVTAPNKTSEDIQKSPVSIQYFSGDDLDDAKVDDVYDVIGHTANIHSRHNSVHHSLTIRGVDSFYPSLYSPVGFYVDGVCYPLNFMHNPELFDIESIELLKGPQGTLYGRNTESGLITITTQKPGDYLGGRIRGEFAGYNTWKADLSVRGPIVSNRLSMGLALHKKKSDGFMENIADGNDKAADIDHSNGRLIVKGTPNDRLDLTLTGDVMKTDDHYGTWRYLDGPMKTDAYKINQNEDQYSRQDGGQISLQARYTGEAFTVASVTGFVDYGHDVFSDMDFTPSPLNRMTGEASYDDTLYSQEITVSSPENAGPLSWMMGVYGFKEQLDTWFDYHIVTMGISFMQPKAEISSTGYAGFGQLAYDFQRFRVTAGLRYDHQKIKGNVTGTYLDMATFSPYAYVCDEDITFGQWLPRVSIAYDITPSSMFYTSAAKGYNTGGFIYTPTANFVDSGFTYDPEYSWNYEAGIKTSFLENRFLANLSVFYIDMKDKQVSETDQRTLQLITTNAGEAHSQGVELEVKARPLQGLDLFAGIGYTDAQFDDFITSEFDPATGTFVPTDYAGNELQFAPKYTYTAGIRYQHKRGFFGRIDVMGRSSFYGDYANIAEADGYCTVNARLGYQGEGYRGDAFDVVLWADNIFDESYLTYITPHGPYNAGIDGKPFIMGITLNYSL